MVGLRHKHGPIGLDIGASNIKMLQLTDDGGRPSILAIAHVALPAPCENSSESRERLIQALYDALRMHPFRGRDVVTALGPGEYQMKNVRLPRMPEVELHSAVQYEARERFDFRETQAEIRYIPVGDVRHGNDLKQEIVVFAALESVVNDRIALLESLKLRPSAIEASPNAVARAFARYLTGSADVNSINVFLDVGFRGTTIVVMRGAEISFLKFLEIGGGELNASVARMLGVTNHEAAELRIRIMREHAAAMGANTAANARSPVPPDMKAAVSDAVRPPIERLSRDVQLCLRYFAVTFRGQKPDCLTLVGGDALEPMLKELLEATVDVPCLIGHPLRGIQQSSAIGGRDSLTLRPAWAVAVGLALRRTPCGGVTRRSIGLSKSDAVGVGA